MHVRRRPRAFGRGDWILRGAGFVVCGLWALGFSSSTRGAAQLAAPEDTLVAQVQAHEDASIALLERLVNVNSGTMNFAGVRKVAELLRPEFESLGFDTHWVDGAAFNRAGHLVADRAGHGKHILLIGHLDTVFEQGDPFQRFERVDAWTARGPGAADMKGGIVVALAALDALQSIGALDNLHLTVVLSGDEEAPGTPLALARKTLIDAAEAADIAIGLENAANDPKSAVIARRSLTFWRISVEAKAAHSSRIFSEDVGAGAIFELSRILDGLFVRLRGRPFLTFNPGVVGGGSRVEFEADPLQARAFGKENIVAGRAIASGDLRALTSADREEAKQAMREIVSAHRPQTSSKIVFQDMYPAMTATDGNSKLLSAYDEVSRDLGFGPVAAVDPLRAGAADVSFTADHVGMAIDGLGLLGGGSHTSNEFADLRTFQTQAQRLAVLLYRLGQQ